jgi:type I restriction enzyme M protein
VADLYHQWQSVNPDGKNFAEPELYRSVGIEEIEQNNWTLVPSKYIEFVDHDLEIDYPKEMAHIQQEMKVLMAREKESQRMLEEAFKGIGYGIE